MRAQVTFWRKFKRQFFLNVLGMIHAAWVLQVRASLDCCDALLLLQSPLLCFTCTIPSFSLSLLFWYVLDLSSIFSIFQRYMRGKLARIRAKMYAARFTSAASVLQRALRRRWGLAAYAQERIRLGNP